MQDIGFTFGGLHFCLAYPDEITDALKQLMRDIQPTGPSRHEKAIEILSDGTDESYHLISATRESDRITGQQPLIDELRSFIRTEITGSLDSGLIIEATGLTVNDRRVLFPCRHRRGTSLLAALLVSQGWGYLTDSLVHIDVEGGCHYLRLPPAVAVDDWPAIGTLLGDTIETRLAGDRMLHLILDPAAVAPADTGTLPSLIVFPHRLPGAVLGLAPLPPGKAAALLMGCLARQNEDDFRQAAALCREVPALRISYGDVSQLEHLGPALAYLSEKKRSSDEIEELLASFQPKHPFSNQNREAPTPEPASKATPEPTPLGEKKTLTIGMATYDDYDGVYFTVQAIRLYHPEVTDDTEILVIDNHPDGPVAQDLKKLENLVANYRYVPCGSRSGTAVRDHLFREANADFVLCLDCHVMIQPGALKRLIDYFQQNSPCRDLLQGPMYAENLKSLHTHFEPVWNDGMYGRWGVDERGADPDGAPFDIEMQGLGLFGCAKEAWVGFTPRFRGFGGEEGYIHEKFRQRGGRTLCLPFLRWVHRFARPRGVPYRVNWNDRIFNYMVGFTELGLDTQPVKEHFVEVLGEEAGNKELQSVEQEIRSPFFFFDAIYCIVIDTGSQRWENMRRRFTALGIEARVRRFKAVETADNHTAACALSHRSIIEEARQQNLENVLVFEDDVLFREDALEILAPSVEELKKQDWSLFYLGGQNLRQRYPPARKCCHLSRPDGLSVTCALAYHRQVFDTILGSIPGTVETMTGWLGENRGIGHFYRTLNKTFLAEPSIAAQDKIVSGEDESCRQRFTLGEQIDSKRPGA